MSDTKVTVQGVSFLEVLGLVFIVLKLTHVIDWSWWVVTLPLWLPLALLGAIIVVSVIFIGVAKVIDILGGK